MLTIKKDISGITYEYILTLNGVHIVMGDGQTSPQEILEFFKNVEDGIKEGISICEDTPK